MEWDEALTDDNKQFLRLILDHVSDCVIAVDTAGRVVFINEPYCKLLGGGQKDYIGHHVTAVVSPETHLHLIANGSEQGYLGNLNVKGKRLVTRQVPAISEGRLVGAVGIALFTSRAQLAALQKSNHNRVLNIYPREWARARYTLNDTFGECELIGKQKVLARKAAAVSVPVIINGETGTGKELMAHALHAESTRSDKPFIAINCAAIPNELVEAELFGYVGGAFTGAMSSGAKGKFEAADGGSLFLDEIAEMPVRSQAALLRVIQDGEIVRVGATSPVTVDVRIICATHSKLADEVENGRFREDLYYRLAVCEIDLPPLRNRTDKIELARHLLEKICAELQRPVPAFSSAACRQIRSHTWPGNVRELRAALERTLVQLSFDESEIRGLLLRPTRPNTACRNESPNTNLEESLKAVERDLIQQAIEKSAHNRTAAARALGINRSTLYKKMQQYRIGNQTDASLRVGGPGRRPQTGR